MAFQPTIHSHDDAVYRISLPVPIDGFDDFISAWVHAAAPVCVVDAGPAVGSSALLSALKILGVRRLDFILLTHIHIDHAGGVRALSDAFPETPVICHPRAIDHLVDPQRLWRGSLNTLGRVARAYGPIEPLPRQRLFAADRLAADGLTAVPTPGHAAHHFQQGETV